ncbi:Zinc-binding dehydrogenase [Rhizoctonia solani]|uniref:Zinc-binding dehydrogenase n=1 Tax=Rhizoctonia solani TaxID=456999 RepID=A0A8H8T2D2_9AGAM|nr:Zinc-binding dehydrogenase [Rhizoctonia solani]QRW25438.1 Zinc-binding dehydrogenase [Rhizoctonia solani]
MTQQHKASLLPQKQGKLEVSTRLTPTPRGTQALVKVTAAAVNPADWKIIETGLFLETYPAVLGYDGAGIIHAVGPEVTNFKVGDRVIFQGTLDYDYTAYQEYALVDTELIAKAPSNVNDDQHQHSPQALSLHTLVYFRKQESPPRERPNCQRQVVLILGGSSSVGQFAIQFARIAGFSTIATTASSQHTEFLKSLGATHVFDRDTDATTIRSAFPSPLGLAFDAISANATQLLAFDLLANPSPVSGAHLTIIAVHNVFGFSDKFRDLSVPFWQKLGEWIEGGELVPNRVQLVNGGLAGVPDALELSRKGVSGVKLVIRPQE